MDRVGREREHFPRAELSRVRRCPDGQPVLPDTTFEHDDRSGGLVVIVKPGVLVLAPTDQPRVDVVVVPYLLVHAGVSRVTDEMRPAFRLIGEIAHKALEFLGGERHDGCVCGARPAGTDRADRAERAGRADHHDTKVNQLRYCIMLPGPAYRAA